MAESNIPCKGIGTRGYCCLHACEQYVNWLLAVLVYTSTALVLAFPVLKLC